MNAPDSDIDQERMSCCYAYDVSPDVPTPVPEGRYAIRLVEGGQYRSIATGRVYTVRELRLAVEDGPLARYEYTRGEQAEPVERVDPVETLAVVQDVPPTPTAVIAYAGGRL